MASLLLIAAVINVFIGAFVFNWAWKQLSPLINSSEKVDSQYSAFRRTDIKKWNKLKFFFGAITVMPIRFVITAYLFLTTFISIK